MESTESAICMIRKCMQMYLNVKKMARMYLEMTKELKEKGNDFQL